MLARTLLGEILEGEDLSDRELEVLVDLAEGLTAAASARSRFLATETVKSYRKRVIAKLGARNGTHAAVLGVRRGLV